MFDFGIGTSELLIIAIVALLVVGPKDLPKLLRSIAQFTSKIRGMAREFQGHLNEAMRETGVEDVKKEVAKMTDLSTVAPDLRKEENELRKAFESSAPKLGPGRPSTQPESRPTTVPTSPDQPSSKAEAPAVPAPPAADEPKAAEKTMAESAAS